MFGIRGWWARHGDAIKAKLQWIVNPANREKAAKAVATSINLMEQAMPYVKMIASLTPTSADDILLAAAEKIGVKIEDIIAEPDWHRKVGLVQDLGGEALREKLKQLLPTFDHGLEIAGQVVTSAEGLDAISHNAFHAPVVLAVNALRAAGEISSALKAPTGDGRPETGGKTGDGGPREKTGDGAPGTDQVDTQPLETMPSGKSD